MPHIYLFSIKNLCVLCVLCVFEPFALKVFSIKKATDGRLLHFITLRRQKTTLSIAIITMRNSTVMMPPAFMKSFTR